MNLEEGRGPKGRIRKNSVARDPNTPAKKYSYLEQISDPAPAPKQTERKSHQDKDCRHSNEAKH